MSGGIQLKSVKHYSEDNKDEEKIHIDENDEDIYENVGYEGNVDDTTENANWSFRNAKVNDIEAAQNDDVSDKSVQEGCTSRMAKTLESIGAFFTKHNQVINMTVAVVGILLYAAYFAFAMYYEFGDDGSIVLLVVTSLIVFWAFIKVIRKTCGSAISRVTVEPIIRFILEHSQVFIVVSCLAVVIAVLLFLIIKVALVTPRNLVSLSGIVIYITLLFMFSHNPAKVSWRPVLWGLGLQFTLALLVLKTTAGMEAFLWIGEVVSTFLSFTDAGSIFVFGENYMDHMFAFKVLPVIIFFSSVISTLYYLGVMQNVISKIAWIMQVTMGTSAAESVNAAGNIFIGQMEAPLLIRPLLPHMTSSEIHAVMVGGYATIAGSVMATYILLGVPANHLITASVMAAPCALAMSKLSYPELEPEKAKRSGKSGMEKSSYQNVVEAASAGASGSIKLVANIAVNLIAFIALLAFINGMLAWIGDRVGFIPPDYPRLSFQLICSYIFWPLAFIMGVGTEDCRTVAELIGYKTFINEFVAFTELGVLIDNTETFKDYNGTWTKVNDDIYLQDTNQTLVGGVLMDRSIVISTYALCGFANIGSLGQVIAGLGALAPERKSDVVRLGVRALVVGTVVTFMNACTAGLLYEEV